MPFKGLQYKSSYVGLNDLVIKEYESPIDGLFNALEGPRKEFLSVTNRVV